MIRGNGIDEQREIMVAVGLVGLECPVAHADQCGRSERQHLHAGDIGAVSLYALQHLHRLDAGRTVAPIDNSEIVHRPPAHAEARHSVEAETVQREASAARVGRDAVGASEQRERARRADSAMSGWAMTRLK